MSMNALIVLGMHRSGTSLLSGLLDKMGVNLGNKLYPPQRGVNEKGFWEHSDIVDTHDSLLLALESKWDDILPLDDKWLDKECVKFFFLKLKKIVIRDFSSVRLWGLKDPRICRLLPLWFNIFKETKVTPRYIFMCRNPFEVVSSLKKRNHFSKEKGLILWLQHNLMAEFYSRNKPRVFIDFNQIVSKPTLMIEKIRIELNVKFPILLAEAEQSILDFVSPNLHHHKISSTIDEKITERLPLMANRLYHLLCQLTMGDDQSLKLVDDIRNEFLAYQKQWPVELVEHIRGINKERADYRIKFFQIYTSWSWKLAKPFWLLEKLLRNNY